MNESDRILSARVVVRSRRAPDQSVPDLERLCRVVLDAHVRRMGWPMEPADYEEALGFLLGEGWLLASRYDPARGGVPFPAWLQGQLRYRLVDHLRGPYGTRKEQRFGVGRLAELDRQATNDDRDSLDALVAGGEGDPGDDREAAFGWLDPARDRDLAGALDRLGLGASGRAAPRARANGRLAA